MGAEQRVSSLGISTAQNIKLLLEQSKNLIGEISETIDANPSDQIPEITAALQFTEDTSRLARTMIEAHGGVIFSRDEINHQPISDPSPTTPRGEGTKPVSDRPKTFAELLKLRIDTKLLPFGHASFTLQELEDISGSKQGVKKAKKKSGFKKEKRFFSREETIELLQALFSTPVQKGPRKEQYSKLNVIQNITRAPKLNELSAEIEFYWKKDTQIDHDTAMQIRGLVQLDKLLSHRVESDTLQPE
ncbi:MAG: hypothetical protein HYT08_00480 [Candidatus Levybacteria bacterium]|nr:hypothetical protein [Candidatus Levybacteria bacterium]